MGEIKHTPGPWKIDFGHPRGNPCGISTKNDGRLVTRFGVFARPSTPEALANARLIAAAPELLKALREAREALHQHYVDWDGEPEDAVPLQLARAKCDDAITKATGISAPSDPTLDGYEAEGGVNNSSLPPQSEGAR